MVSSTLFTSAQLRDIDRRLRDGVSITRIIDDLEYPVKRRFRFYDDLTNSGYRIQNNRGRRCLVRTAPSDAPVLALADMPAPAAEMPACAA